MSLRIAVGPANSEFGSWTWVGEAAVDALGQEHDVRTFDASVSPEDADVVLFLKFKPAFEELTALKSRARLIYLPVDVYGSAAEIDSDRESLRLFDRVLLHSERLQRYFCTYASTKYVDHPLKYVLDEPRPFVNTGPLLWVGRKCNLPPIVTWANSQQLNRPLWILTNDVDSENPSQYPGFDSQNEIRLEEWSPQKHLEWMKVCCAAVDIKDEHFRSRHKPPAKMLDFLASGLPVIANRSSPSFWFGRQQKLTVISANEWKSELTAVDPRRTLTQAWQLRDVLNKDRCGEALRHIVASLAEDVSQGAMP